MRQFFIVHTLRFALFFQVVAPVINTVEFFSVVVYGDFGDGDTLMHHAVLLVSH